MSQNQTAPPKVNGVMKGQEAAPEQVVVQPQGSDELQLPLSVVNKLIKDALPNGVIVSREARQAISKAASIFVRIVRKMTTSRL